MSRTVKLVINCELTTHDLHLYAIGFFCSISEVLFFSLFHYYCEIIIFSLDQGPGMENPGVFFI